MTINDMLIDIKNQLESEDNFTEWGDPQAWIYLENGRSIEIVHEEECIPPDEQYFSVRLHCTDDEFDNRYFYKTVGVIDDDCSYDTPNVLDIEAIRQPLEYILKVNESEKVMR